MVTFNNRFASLDQVASKFDGNISAGTPLAYDVDSGTFKTDNALVKEETAKVLAELDPTDPGTKEIKEGADILDSLMVAVNLKKINRDSLMAADPTGYFKSLEEDRSGSNTFSSKMEFFGRMIQSDTLYSFQQAQDKYNIKSSFSNKMAFQVSNSFLRIVDHPSDFINSTISKLPFVIFFFLPVFTVFIWLVYIRKKYTYTDHLIFSFHNQSLLFILLILSLIIDSIFDVTSAVIFITIFSVYLFLAMKKFYGQGTFKTIVKYLFLNTIFTFLAVFTVIMLLTGSVFTY
jgi:hypothetical protein